MTLNIIGIGLNDEKDISLKGLELVKKSDIVYLENYTSKLNVPLENLEKLYGTKIIPADRETVEQKPDIIENAKTKNVSLLVVGDVFGATTHYDIFLRAKKQNIPVNLVHNASILNTVAVTGLMLYNFGKTTSIPFPQENFKPETAYDAIKINKEKGFHTLVLLDLKPEQEKFMTVQQGIEILLEIENKRNEKVFTQETMLLGCARIGGDFKIKYANSKQLLEEDFGTPLHCLIVPGKTHFVEEEALEQWK